LKRHVIGLLLLQQMNEKQNQRQINKSSKGTKNVAKQRNQLTQDPD